MLSLRNIRNTLASAILASNENGDIVPVQAGAQGSILTSQGPAALPTFSAPLGNSGGSFPIGFIAIWPGDTMPTGWLLCDGSEISRTAYADLFALVGTTYGAGDGVSTFLLPDFRGRTPIGYGLGSGLTITHVLAETGGEETAVLTQDQLASHRHAYERNISSTTTTDGAQYGWKNSSTPASGAAGSGTGHQNMQPSLAMNFVIKG